MKVIKWILLANSICIILLSGLFAVSHHITIQPETLKIFFYSGLILILISLVRLWLCWLISNASAFSYNTDAYNKAYKICNIFVKAAGVAYVVWYFMSTNGVDRESMEFRNIMNIFWLPVSANAILVLLKKTEK